MRSLRLVIVALFAGISDLPATAQSGRFDLVLTGGTGGCIGGSYGGFVGAGSWGPYFSGRAQFTSRSGLTSGVLAEISYLRFEGRPPRYPNEKAFMANPLYGIGLYIGKTEAMGRKMQFSYLLSVGGVLMEKSTILGKDETRGAVFLGGDLLYEYQLGKKLSLVGGGGIRWYGMNPGRQSVYGSQQTNNGIFKLPSYSVLNFPLALGVKYSF